MRLLRRSIATFRLGVSVRWPRPNNSVWRAVEYLRFNKYYSTNGRRRAFIWQAIQNVNKVGPPMIILDWAATQADAEVHLEPLISTSDPKPINR